MLVVHKDVDTGVYMGTAFEREKKGPPLQALLYWDCDFLCSLSHSHLFPVVFGWLSGDFRLCADERLFFFGFAANVLCTRHYRTSLPTCNWPQNHANFVCTKTHQQRVAMEDLVARFS